MRCKSESGSTLLRFSLARAKPKQASAHPWIRFFESSRIRKGLAASICLLACLHSGTFAFPSPQQYPDETASKIQRLENTIRKMRQRGAFDEALSRAKEVRTFVVDSLGEDDWRTGDAMRLVGTLEAIAALPEAEQAELADADRELDRIRAKSVTEARAAYDTQIDIRTRLLGEHHEEVAKVLYLLAQLLFHDAGDLAAAKPFYARAAELQREKLGDRHPQLAFTLHDLGALCCSQGDYTSGVSMLKEAAAVFRATDHRLPFGQSSFVLAGRLQEIGEYASAEYRQREALEAFRESLGEKSVPVVRSMNSLCVLLCERGNYADAEAIGREAVALWRRLDPDGNPSSATSLNNLAQALHGQGDFAEAALQYSESLKILRRDLGPRHPHVAWTLINASVLHKDKGDLEAAEHDGREALEILREGSSREFATAACLNQLASLQYRKGDYAGAEELLEDALSVMGDRFGEWHPDNLELLCSLGRLHLELGNHERSLEFLERAADVFEIARLRATTSGLRRAEFRESPYRMMAALSARRAEPRKAWERLEAGLGRGLLDAATGLDHRQLTDVEQQRRTDLLTRLSEIEEQISTSEAAPADRQLRDDLRREHAARKLACLRFEHELADKYGVTGGQIYSLERIQASLTPGTAIVAWLDVDVEETATIPSGERWVCIVRHEGLPVWLPLAGRDEESSWTGEDRRLTSQCRDAMMTRPTRRQTPSLGDLLQQLYIQRMAAVDTHLSAPGDKPALRHLICIATGPMAGIPLEAVVPHNRYTISYAPSFTMYARLVEARRKRASSIEGGFLAIGDPIVSTPTSATEIPRVAAAPSKSNAGQARLPATRREIEAITAIVLRASGADDPDEQEKSTAIDVLLGQDATEPELARLAASGGLSRYRFVHIATHGIMDDRRPFHSALILSPHRQPNAVHGPEFHDGRLTPAEILREWKLQADVVSLSACRTALGKFLRGEGYVGFAQALLLAGADSLISSLWDVDDTATALLMVRFYENLLGAFSETRSVRNTAIPAGKPMPRAAALLEARTWLRELSALEARSRCRELDLDPGLVHRGEVRLEPGKPVRGLPEDPPPYADPYFWASFILIGAAE